MDCTALLSKEFGIAPPLVENIIALIDEGNTIPFIARYRKERTGSCDDQTLRALADRLAYLRGLQKRREEVLSAIGEQGKLTESLAADIAAAETLARLESDTTRPLLMGADKEEKVRKLLADRMPKYTAAADYIIDTGGKSFYEIINEVERAME